MRWVMQLLFVVSLFMVIVGCGGGTTQEEMMRNAIRRSSPDEDEEDEKPAPKNEPQKAPAEQPVVAVNENVPKANDTSSNNSVASTHKATQDSKQVANNVVEPSAPKPVKETVVAPAVPSKPMTPKERVKRTISNMEKIGEAMTKYTEKTKCFPAHAIYDDIKYHRDANPMLSWRVTLLPYLGYEDLYKKFNLNEPWSSPNNKKLLKDIPPIYQSPERMDEKTNYLAIQGPSSAIALPQRGVICRDFQGETFIPELEDDGDGQANTAVIVEVDDELAVPWTKPLDFEYNSDNPGSGLGTLRGNGFMTIWGNGWLTWIPSSTPNAQMTAMFTSRGREKFSALSIAQEPDVVLASLETPTTEAPSSPTPMPNSVASKIPVADPGSGVAPIETPSGKSAELRNRFRDLMAMGRQRDAFQYYFASVLISDSAKMQLDWYQGSKRPSAGLRWGVYVDFTEISEEKKDNDRDRNRTERNQPTIEPSPIQPRNPTPEDLANTRRFRNDDDDEDDRRNGRDKERISVGMEEFKRYTGELGQRVLEELKHHVLEGRSGSIFNETSSPDNIPVPGDYAEKYNPVQHTNAIMIFRVHDSKYSRHLARQNDLDVLVQFVVEVKKLKNGKVQNTTTIRAFDTHGVARIFESQPLININVQEDRDNPLKTDPIPGVFERMRASLAKNISASPLPEGLKVEHVRSRVAALLARKVENPLPTLAEIRFYHDKGYLSRIETREAYRGILGQQRGTALAEGSSEERLEVLQPWLPALGRINSSIQ